MMNEEKNKKEWKQKKRNIKRKGMKDKEKKRNERKKMDLIDFWRKDAKVELIGRRTEKIEVSYTHMSMQTHIYTYAHS